MTIRKLGIIQPQTVETITNHLADKMDRLAPDMSNYARNRQRYWLQHEWDLKNREFIPAIRDERIWNYCKHWMPDADLGLVVYGPIGITPHRDDSYADWRGVGINLGEIESWYYDCQYPNYYWTRDKNPSDPVNYQIPVGGVFEFNTKNPHAANNPAKDRWAIFLWKISKKFRAQFEQETER
ncbi:MAG: hypothetical protein CME17_06385 [Gemmatimonadetes bacterium]|nr:hypothetical protein [Gemmatimonadota bacterium]